jgi:predicted adenylyl cyclase CyaB
VEIKARVPDLAAFSDRVKPIADFGPQVIDQEDTFFHSTRGRLKFRKFLHSSGELIYYERPDARNPTECRYFICPTTKPDELLELLTQSNGVRGVVRKRRILYTAGQTRIHLDEVDELGHFVELEVVLRQDQNSEDGIRIAEDLMNRLLIDENSLVERAYIDLIEGKKSNSSI